MKQPIEFTNLGALLRFDYSREYVGFAIWYLVQRPALRQTKSYADISKCVKIP